MFERIKYTLKSCRSAYQRRRELTTKLLQNPFFPILFIGEVVKTAAIAYATTGAIITPAVLVLAVLAVVVTTIWIFAEVILKNVDEYTENVVDNSKDALEKATDGDDNED